ncbi:Ribosomal protein S21e, partial [Prunus dulcis]
SLKESPKARTTKTRSFQFALLRQPPQPPPLRPQSHPLNSTGCGRFVSVVVDSLTKMQNEEGVITELYIPRKCSATNRLITSKDHASVQINVGHLDENGIYTGQFSTFALCGYVRAQGDADGGLDRLWQKKKAELNFNLLEYRETISTGNAHNDLKIHVF